MRLHECFDEELKRQAAKAAEAARQATAVVAKSKGKRSERSRHRTHNTAGNTRALEQAATSLLEPPLTPAAVKKKKKKQSALANASNPHHLRNYVPTRLPQPGHTGVLQGSAQNVLGPLPLRFLSAELPPRGRDVSSVQQQQQQQQQPTAPTTQLTDPAEEWICPWCEYSLFYSDDLALGRAVRARKKILKRRRRAVERAAAAASGRSIMSSVPARAAEEDQEALFEAPYDDVPASTMTQTKWRGERRKGPDRGGTETAYVSSEH